MKSFKLSKSGRIVLLIGIFLVLFVILFMRRQGQNTDIQVLQTAIQNSSAPKVAQDRKTLETQLSQLEAKKTQVTQIYNSVIATYPPSSRSVEFGETLFQVAASHNISITNLATDEPSQQTKDNVTYFSTAINFSAEGKPDNLLVFLDDLTKNEHFTNVSADIFTLTNTVEVIANGGIPAATGTEPGGGETPVPTPETQTTSVTAKAGISLVLFSYAN